MPKITITAVGAFITHGDVEQSRPVGRGAVVDVDQKTADRLISENAARLGEHEIDPVLAPAPSVADPVPDDPEPTTDLGGMSDDELAGFVGSATVADVETAVGDDKELAARVLAAEQARGDKARSTLVEKLEALAV